VASHRDRRPHFIKLAHLDRAPQHRGSPNKPRRPCRATSRARSIVGDEVLLGPVFPAKTPRRHGQPAPGGIACLAGAGGTQNIPPTTPLKCTANSNHALLPSEGIYARPPALWRCAAARAFRGPLLEKTKLLPFPRPRGRPQHPRRGSRRPAGSQIDARAAGLRTVGGRGRIRHTYRDSCSTPVARRRPASSSPRQRRPSPASSHRHFH